ncbi:MAG: transporter substrate-binding domain-containing protein [Chloroflexota bacterium]
MAEEVVNEVVEEVAATAVPETQEPEVEVEEESVAETAVTSPLATTILENGVVRVGINADPLYPFIYLDEDAPRGFEIDLAQALVAQMFGEDMAIEWVSVTTENRLQALADGEIDLLIRNTTHTVSREADALWTRPYFLDGQRVLVTNGGGIEDIAQLDGEIICVPLNSEWANNLEGYTATQGFSWELIELGEGGPFMEGACSAVSLDWSLLMHQGLAFNMMGVTDAPWRTIGPLLVNKADGTQLGYEPIAIGTPLSDPLFRDLADEALGELVADGIWQDLYDEWMPEEAPWSSEEMLNAPPAER